MNNYYKEGEVVKNHPHEHPMTYKWYPELRLSPEGVWHDCGGFGMYCNVCQHVIDVAQETRQAKYYMWPTQEELNERNHE